MVAVQVVLEHVLENDVRAVVAPRDDQRRSRAEREGIAEVEPCARRGGLEAREAFADEHATADGLPRPVERAELRACPELDVGLVVRYTDREAILSACKVAREIGLQAEPRAVLLGARSIDGAADERVV